jgi:hypothetical protein
MTETKQPEISRMALAAYIPEQPVITAAKQENTDG